MLSGAAAFAATAALVDPALVVDSRVADGERFAAGDVLATVRGPSPPSSPRERTGLNFLCRLSGVATLTARYVAETAGTAARIAATRKTTPGLRALEKQAVVHGGGTPHRFGLFDGAMIKDNHVRRRRRCARRGAAGARRRGARAQPRGRGRHARAARRGAGRRRDHRAARQHGHADGARGGGARRRSRPRRGLRRRALERVRELADAGVDIISVGALTTRAPWIDLGLDVEG